MKAKEITVNIPISIKIDSDGNVSAANDEPMPDETSTMVPPLQQDLELKKKEAGIECAFDDCEDEEEKPEDLNDYN